MSMCLKAWKLNTNLTISLKLDSFQVTYTISNFWIYVFPTEKKHHKITNYLLCLYNLCEPINLNLNSIWCTNASKLLNWKECVNLGICTLLYQSYLNTVRWKVLHPASVYVLKYQAGTIYIFSTFSSFYVCSKTLSWYNCLLPAYERCDPIPL